MADLSLTKTSSPDPGLAGDTVTSTLTVENTGPSPALDVVVTDRLPAGVTFVSATPGCSAADRSVTCAVGTVASGATVDAHRDRDDPVGLRGDLARERRLGRVQHGRPGSRRTTRPGRPSRSPGEADLAVTKTADPGTVTPGQSTTYTVTVRNDGPSDAVNVLATDQVADPNLALTSATAPGAACTVTGDVAQCSIPVLAPGASLTMTVVGRVAPDAPGALAVTNTATVSSDTRDPDDADNTASSTITTTAPQADLATTKSAGAAVAGGQVTYTVTTTNNGPSSASDVVLADALPAGAGPGRRRVVAGHLHRRCRGELRRRDAPRPGPRGPGVERHRDDHGRRPPGLPGRPGQQHRDDSDPDGRSGPRQRRRHRRDRGDRRRRRLGDQDRGPGPAGGRRRRDVHGHGVQRRAVDGPRRHPDRRPARRSSRSSRSTPRPVPGSPRSRARSATSTPAARRPSPS